MFIKLTSSGPNRYVQLVEAYRDATDGRPKQRTFATLGRLGQLNTELKSVISGLQRVTGQPTAVAAPPSVPPTLSFDAARDFGDVWMLTELWNALGFDSLRTVFRHTRHSIDVEALTRVMVFNRLCDPDSKLGVLRWLETVALPGTSLESIDHQHLLRAMDALIDHKSEVAEVMSGLLRPLVDQDLAMVFYDMTCHTHPRSGRHLRPLGRLFVALNPPSQNASTRFAKHLAKNYGNGTTTSTSCAMMLI